MLIGYLVFDVIIIVGAATFLGPIVSKLFGKDLTFSGRTLIWPQVILKIWQKPVAGWGYMSGEESGNLFGNLAFSSAHNQLLNTLWQGGVILLFIVMVLFLLTLNVYRKTTHKMETVAVLLVLVILVDMTFESILNVRATWLILLMLYNWGICILNIYSNEMTRRKDVMIEKQGKLSVTLVISALAVFIGYVINFLLTPYVTDRLGIEIYGFVSIAKNIVGYAGIVTIALTAFVVRFISVSYHKGNYEEAKSYYSSSIAASIVLSGSIFLIAAIIILKLEYLLNIPENSVVSIKILFLIVFLTFVVTTMTTPFSAAAFIKNKLDIVGIIKILGYIADAGVLILLFSIFKPNVFFVGLGSLATAVVTLIGNYAITKVTTKELQFDSKTVSFQKVKDMMGNGIWTSLNQLGNVLNSGLDLVISNLM